MLLHSVAHRRLTCQGETALLESPHGGLRRGLRRLRDQLARRRGAALATRLARVRARARGASRRLPVHVRRPHAPRLHARGARVVASAVDGWRRVRRAEGRARPAGASSTSTPTSLPAPPIPTARRRSSTALWKGTSPSWRRHAEPGRCRVGGVLQRRSWRTRTSPSACSAPSCGRAAGLGLGRTALRRLGRRGLLEFAGGTLVTCRDWVTGTFRSEAAHGLLAPWVLHTGLGPDQATSGFMTQVIAAALQLGGMPVPLGGGRVLVDGLAGIVRDAGGEVRAGADVERVLVAGGEGNGCAARGRRGRCGRAGGRGGRHADAALRRLLGAGEVPDDGDARAAAGSATAAPRCRSTSRSTRRRAGRAPGRPSSRRCPIVHVTPGLDGVSRAVNEAERGLLPAEATIVCGQPCALDPARAPDGKSILWIQLQELPAGPSQGRRRRRDRRR